MVENWKSWGKIPGLVSVPEDNGEFSSSANEEREALAEREGKVTSAGSPHSRYKVVGLENR